MPLSPRSEIHVHGMVSTRAVSKGCETDERWKKVAEGTMKIVHGTSENKIQKKGEKIEGKSNRDLMIRRAIK